MASRVTRKKHTDGSVMLQLDNKGRAPQVQGRDKRLSPGPLEEGANRNLDKDAGVAEATAPSSAQPTVPDSAKATAPDPAQSKAPGPAPTEASGSAKHTVSEPPQSDSTTSIKKKGETRRKTSKSKTNETSVDGGPEPQVEGKDKVVHDAHDEAQTSATGQKIAAKTKKAAGSSRAKKDKANLGSTPTVPVPAQGAANSAALLPSSPFSALQAAGNDQKAGGQAVNGAARPAGNGSSGVTAQGKEVSLVSALQAAGNDQNAGGQAVNGGSSVTAQDSSGVTAQGKAVSLVSALQAAGNDQNAGGQAVNGGSSVTAQGKKVPLFLPDPDSPVAAAVSADNAELTTGAPLAASKRPPTRRRAGSAPASSSSAAGRKDDHHGKREPRESDVTMLSREEMRKQLVEAVVDAEAEEGEVDDDGAPIVADASKPSHARGPMADWQKQRITEVTENYLKVIAEIAQEYNRSESAVLAEAKIALKLSRKPSTYNRYSQWWCATHSHEDEDGEPLTLPELRKLWLADYQKDVRDASPEDRAKLEAMLTKWEEAFVKNNAELVKKEGNLYKMMLRIREDFTTLAAYYYRLYDVVVSGFVVSSRPGDAHAMQANSVFAPTSALVKLFSGSNLAASMGELGAFATTHRAADIPLTDFSKQREDWICDLTDQKAFKQVVQKILRLLQSELWSIPERPQVMWTKSLMQNVRKRVVLTGWIPLLPTPDTRKRLLSNAMLCKELVRAYFAARRGETSGVQRLGFRPMTATELSYRESSESRGDWFKVPIWIDNEGNTVKTVADAHTEFAADGGKPEGGGDGGDVKPPGLNDDFALDVEDEAPVKPAKRKRAVVIDVEDDPPPKRKRAPGGKKTSGSAATSEEGPSRKTKKRAAETSDDEVADAVKPGKKRQRKRAGEATSRSSARNASQPKQRAPPKLKRPGSQRKNPFARDPSRPRKPGNYTEIDDMSGDEELQLDAESEQEDEEQSAASTTDDEQQPSAPPSHERSQSPSHPQGTDQVGGGGSAHDSLGSFPEQEFVPHALPYEGSFVHALASGTAVGLNNAGSSGVDLDAFLDHSTLTAYPTEATLLASMDARLFDWNKMAPTDTTLDASALATLYDVNMDTGYLSVNGAGLVLPSMQPLDAAAVALPPALNAAPVPVRVASPGAVAPGSVAPNVAAITSPPALNFTPAPVPTGDVMLGSVAPNVAAVTSPPALNFTPAPVPTASPGDVMLAPSVAAVTSPPALNVTPAPVPPVTPAPVPAASPGATAPGAMLLNAPNKDELLKSFTPEELAAAFALVLQGRASKQATAEGERGGA